MSLLTKCKVGVLLLLLRERQWPAVFEQLSYDENEEPLSPHLFLPYPHNNSTVFSFRLIPNYFKCRVNAQKFNIRQVKQHNWGYAINLKSYKSAGDYISDKFNSKHRKGIIRYIKRLEHCFAITYTFYHGDIEKSRYDQLMAALKAMIINRFKEKDAKHLELHLWDMLLERTFDQILKKEASLFVIYHGKRPIQISLNYHLGKILFSSIASYDINYSKFGLGHVEIYKQLDWCCKHDYTIYEMGVGGTDYKKRWSNFKYNFEHHILYRKNNFKSSIVARMEILRVTIKEFLKSLGINEIHQKIYTLNFKSAQINMTWQPSGIYDISKGGELENLLLKEVPLNDPVIYPIKRYINNFLYSTVQKEEEIKVFQTNDQSYIIQSKDRYQKLISEN